MNIEYKKKYKEGVVYQDFVTEVFFKMGLFFVNYTSEKYQFEFGENSAGFEIKLDNNFRQTGNLYIEIAEKSDANNKEYIPSGIYGKSWIYIIGDYQTIYIFSTEQLKKMHKYKKYEYRKIPTSKGFLLPIEKAEKFLVIKKIEVK